MCCVAEIFLNIITLKQQKSQPLRTNIFQVYVPINAVQLICVYLQLLYTTKISSLYLSLIFGSTQILSHRIISPFCISLKLHFNLTLIFEAQMKT